MNVLQAKLEKQLLENVADTLSVEAMGLGEGVQKDDLPTARLEETERELVNVVQCLRLVIASRKLVSQ